MLDLHLSVTMPVKFNNLWMGESMGRQLRPSVRRFVFDRDERICRYCGAPADCVDHVKPVCRGGSDDPEHLVASCTPCRRSRVSISKRST